MKRLIPSPQQALKGLAKEAVGVVALGVAQKYVPNIYVRWGIYTVLGAWGVFYPLTRAILTATNMDDFIENNLD